MSLKKILEETKRKNSNEPEFIQAVEEVLDTLMPVLKKHPEYMTLRILERTLEPERIISFRVTWLDDSGKIQLNRGYRVQMNSAIGPYKGGLRFHPSVTPGVLKFLAYEQTFKNALTGLPLGSGKGGSDFDPKGKSENEIMRFCQAFMIELARHIDHRLDVPAGDIGVGSREIGFLFGMYKKIKNQFSGVLTGKGIAWGGSLIRNEATGYGLIYFAENMLFTKNDSIKNKICLVSGSGNVAQHAIEKINHLGGKAVTVSDSGGVIYDPKGIDETKLAFIKELKNNRRERIKKYQETYPESIYTPTEKNAKINPIWTHRAHCAFPCATQNEINEEDTHNLVKGGITLVAEGANMPISPEGIAVLLKQEIMYAPGKASNAGGVATSGLEMTQNYTGEHWTREEVDKKLQSIMKKIHDTCLEVARKYNHEGNYMAGANMAGFLKIAEAVKAQGIV